MFYANIFVYMHDKAMGQSSTFPFLVFCPLTYLSPISTKFMNVIYHVLIIFGPSLTTQLKTHYVDMKFTKTYSRVKCEA